MDARPCASRKSYARSAHRKTAPTAIKAGIQSVNYGNEVVQANVSGRRSKAKPPVSNVIPPRSQWDLKLYKLTPCLVLHPSCAGGLIDLVIGGYSLARIPDYAVRNLYSAPQKTKMKENPRHSWLIVLDPFAIRRFDGAAASTAACKAFKVLENSQ